MNDAAGFGLFAAITAAVLFFVRSLIAKKRPTMAHKPPEQRAAKQARAMIENDGNAEVTQVFVDLEQPNRLQRLIERANRRRKR